MNVGERKWKKKGRNENESNVSSLILGVVNGNNCHKILIFYSYIPKSIIS